MSIFQNLVGALSGADKAPLPSNAVLVDVRSPGEYSSGALEGARSIPLDVLMQKIQTLFPDKQTPLVLYCASGARSGWGSISLQQLGYTNVHNAGGIHAAAQRMQLAVIRT